MSYSIPTVDEVNERVWTLVHQTPAFDIHTNLHDPRLDDSYLKTGIDELLTTQPLIEELFRYSPMSPSDPTKALTRDEFDSLPIRIQSELIWHRLFLANTPLSESTRSVLTALGLLQLDPKTRNLGAYRNFSGRTSKQEQVYNILTTSNLEGVVTCPDPLNKDIRKSWKKKNTSDKFYTALDLSELICDWNNRYSSLIKQGFEVKRRLDKTVYPRIKAYLSSIIESSDAVYLHLTLPSGMSFSNKSDTIIKLLQKCIAPVLIEKGLPLSITFNENKHNITLNSLKLNQALQFSNIEFIDELITRFESLRLLVTDSNYKNQYSLTLLSKKHSNLMPMSSSSHLSAQTSYTDITRVHLDQLGASFIAQSSGASVYEELLPEWAHSRWVLAALLQEKYTNLYRTGWRVTEEEIYREVHNLLSGNAKAFINKS